MDKLHTTNFLGQKNFDEFLMSLVPPEHHANIFSFAKSLIDIYSRVKSLRRTWHEDYIFAEKKFLKFCSEELFVYLPFPCSLAGLTSALKKSFFKVEQLSQKDKSKTELEQILVQETFLSLGAENH